MAEIRCPMCGKPNPDNLDSCQFCQARLKPLLAPSEDSIIPDQSESDSELPDWFVDSDAGFDDTDNDTPFDSEDSSDDWMTRLGGDSDLEEQSQLSEESEPIAESRAASRMDFNNNGIPDWLEDMESDRATPSLGESQKTSDADPPVWFSDENEMSEPIDESTDLPDQLSGLAPQDEKAQIGDALKDDEASLLAADDGNLPDWLATGSDEEASLPASEESSDLPEWLSNMGGEETPPLAETIPLEDSKPEETVKNDGLPEWLTADEEDPPPGTIPTERIDPVDGTSGYVSQETIPIKDYFQSDEDAPVIGAEETELPDWLSDSVEEAESIPTAAEDDLPEWLSGMDAADATPTDDESPALSTDNTDLPGWLTDLSAQEEVQTEDVPKPQKPFDIDTGALYGMLADDNVDVEAPLSVDAELPEELTDSPPQTPLDTNDIHHRESAPAVDDSDALPDWLSGEGELEPDDVSTEVAEAGDLPDWLANFGDQEEAETEEIVQSQAADSPLAADDELPAWLSDSLTDEAESTISPAAEDEDLPEWLAGFGEQDGVLAEEIPTEEAAPTLVVDSPLAADDELPAWLSDSLTDEAESTVAPIAEDEDLPEWLAGFGEQDGVLAEEIPTEEAAPALVVDSPLAADEELPTSFSDSLADEAESTVAPIAEDEDLPEWLVGFGEQDDVLDEEIPTEEGAVSQALDSPIATDDGLPAWLSDGQVDETDDVPSLAEDDLSEGLADEKGVDIAEGIALAAGLAKVTGDSDEEVESSAPPAVEGDVPDWLSNIDGVEVSSTEDTSDFVDQDEVPAWLSDVDGEEIEAAASVEENLPDWLSEIEGIEDIPEREPVFDSSAVEESRAVPDWLSSEISLPTTEDEIKAESLEATPFVTEDEFDDDLFEMDQLADWISDEPQSELDQTQEQTGPVDGLEPAELPGWLAAMRPVETALSDAAGVEKPGPMENSGPLAGLYGVLAAEPDISRLKKPPVYSSKLHITDAQQTHANVLRELLETEKQTQPLPLSPLISSQRVFRIILSTILLVIAFVAVLAGSEIATMPTPGNIPLGVEQTRNLVNSLTQEDTALLAFDYEPALMGEMDATSAAVVDHMMLKGAKLVLVSTSPTGPALAEHFINTVQGAHGYVSGSQYVNLGYVPGGVTGLAAFARNPRWVFPDTLNGVPAWETEPLQNIEKVSDFSLVVLITDNSNTARAWVEQVNPELDVVPLVALVSAQAEPMVRPYFDNQETQIDGLVSGLSGGAAYEVYVRPNIASTYWDAFNIVLIVAVSAILIGGFITVISTLLAQRKGSEGESE